MKCILVSILILFAGCGQSKGGSLIAYEIENDEGYVTVTYGKSVGTYYGTFELFPSDETLAIIRNDGTKFRSEVVNYEKIEYQGNKLDGILILKRKKEVFSVCKLSFSQWKEILHSIESWSEESKSRFVVSA